jgi:small neutral amino acid transporter SnatA (MarC family)
LATVFSLLIFAVIFADQIVRYIGMAALQAFSKLVMVLLAAIAVNFIRVGIMQAIQGAK